MDRLTEERAFRALAYKFGLRELCGTDKDQALQDGTAILAQLRADSSLRERIVRRLLQPLEEIVTFGLTHSQKDNPARFQL